MTRCYKIKGKKVNQVQGDTFLKIDGIHVDVKVPLHIYINTKSDEHFVSCEYDNKTKSYKILKVYSKDGRTILKVNN